MLGFPKLLQPRQKVASTNWDDEMCPGLWALSLNQDTTLTLKKKILVHQTKIEQASDSFKLTNVMACTTPENLVKIEQKLPK